MALTNCRECGKEISTTCTDKCPHCGAERPHQTAYEFEQGTKRGNSFAVAFFVTAVIFIIVMTICIYQFLWY